MNRPPLSSGSLSPRVSVSNLPSGEPGARVTLDRMRALVNASLVDPVVINTAKGIVSMLPARAYVDHIRAVRDWMSDRFLFCKDPLGVELLHEPRYLLDIISRSFYAQGDCDDAAILSAALIKAIGLRARFVAVGFLGESGPLVHVYTIAEDPVTGRWYELDTTRAAGRAAVRPNKFRSAEV